MEQNQYHDMHIFTSNKQGPTIVFGAFVHGDEIIGNTVVQYVKKKVAIQDFTGTIVLIIGNPKAKDSQQRFIDKDLNRSFGQEISPDVNIYETIRAHHIKSFLKDHAIKPTHVYDFHSTSAPSEPMMICTNNPDCITHAQQFSQGHILTDILHRLHGITFSGYIQSLGAIDIAFECGQHEEKAGHQRAIDYLDRIWEYHFRDNFQILSQKPQTYITTEMYFTQDPNFMFTKSRVGFQHIPANFVRGIEKSTGKKLSFTKDKYIIMPNQHITRDIQYQKEARVAAFAEKLL